MSRCPECGIDPGECECGVGDSSCITVDGAGTVSNPFGASPVLDPDPANLLTCSGSGLLATLPSVITSPPAAQIYRSTNQTFTTDPVTICCFAPVLFNQVRYNSGGMVSGSNLIAPLDGIYVITLNLRWGNASGSASWAQLRVNGSPITEDRVLKQSDNFGSNNILAERELRAGDMVAAFALVSPLGGTLTAFGHLPFMSLSYRRGLS